MNTNDIRKMIKEKISEESKTNNLKNQIASIVDQEAAANIIEFIKNYLRVTPDLMDKVYAEAQQHNLIHQFQPIFDDVFTYWTEEYDFIPDNHGLAGICDDSYLSLSLMHMIASTQVQGHGVLLENINLSQMNNDMRIIIGPQISSQLDATANATYQSINIQNSISALVNMFNDGMPFGNSFLGFQNMVDQQRIDDEVNVRLGAMGVF